MGVVPACEMAQISSFLLFVGGFWNFFFFELGSLYYIVLAALELTT